MTGEGLGVGAILNVDMVGSTHLLVSLGVDAQITALNQLHRIVGHAASERDGEVRDSSGDGIVVRFASVSHAMMAAIEVRDAVASAEEFEVRVGIDLAEGDTASAESVERACPPGGVAVHDRVYRCLRSAAPELEFSALTGASHELRTPSTDALRVLEKARHDARLKVVLFSNGSDRAAVRISELVLGDADCAVVDTNGNGHVAIFRSARAAVEAAAELHAVGAAAALDVETSDAVRFRIGISLGEVVVDGVQVFGQAMIEAARLHDYGEEGTTLIESGAAAVADVANGESLGPVALKGFSESVEAVAVAAGPVLPLIELPAVLRRPRRFGFTGRSVQLNALRTAWSKVKRGELCASMVIGEEGVGKTRLVQEFASEVFDDGSVVLLGSCFEEVERPFQPIVDVLRAMADVDSDVASAVRGDGGHFGVLFDASGVTPQSADTDRHHLFGAVSGALRRLAQRRPVLLVIDDVQWASLDMLQLLEWVMSNTDPSRVMLLATCRVEALDHAHSAERLLETRRDGVSFERHHIERLSMAEVSAMLESRVGRALEGPEVAMAQHVMEITGGSPLYAEEVMTHFAATGVIRERDGDWELRMAPEDLPIPESVTDLMGARLRRLDDDVLGVLTVAAVMGPTFDFEIVAAVMDRSVDDVLDAVDVAADARLVHEDDRGEPSVFADEIVRAALLSRVRSSRRARMHRKIAEVLERDRAHEFAQIARHWEASVGTDAKRNAITALGQVIQRNLNAAAYESAADGSQRVIDLHRQLGDDDPAVLGRTYYALGSALRTLGRPGYKEPLAAAATCARITADGALLGRAAVAMMRPGAWYPEAGVVDGEIIEMCEDALVLLDADHPLRPRVLAALATNLAYHPDVERRRSLLAEAQAGAREVGDPQLIGTTLAAEIITEHAPDFGDRRNEIAAEVRRMGRLADDRNLLLTGGIVSLLGEYEHGRFDECEPLLAELEELAKAERAYWPSFLIGHFRTAIAVLRCEPGAQTLVDADRDAFQEHDVDWFGVWLFQTGMLAQYSGDLSELLLSFGEASTMFDDEGWGLKWNYAIASAHMEAGHFTLAVEAIEANLHPDFDRYWLTSVQTLGLLGLELERTDYCELTIERLTPYQGRCCVVGLGVGIGALVDNALGQAWLGLGEFARAEGLFRDALALAERIRAPFFAVVARRFLARTLIEQNQHGEAARLLDSAMSDARRFGFVMEESAVGQMMAVVGEHAVNDGTRGRGV